MSVDQRRRISCSPELEGRQRVKHLLNPVGAYGLNTCCKSCVVALNEEEVIFVVGTLLVLQNFDDPGKFCILPQHDDLRTIFGMCFHMEGQVLAVCASSWDQKFIVEFYHTNGLRIGGDVNNRFRRARSFRLDESQCTESLANEGNHICMDFSSCGKLLIAYIHGTVYHFDWQRSKILFSYKYPGERVKCITFSPHDSSKVACSGQGFVKLWKLKQQTMSPSAEIHGLDLQGQTVVHHAWDQTREVIFAVTVEGSVYMIDPARGHQHFFHKVHDGLGLTAVLPISQHTFLSVGSTGKIGVFTEKDSMEGRKKIGQGKGSFELDRVVTTKDLADDILGVVLTSKKLIIFTRHYIGCLDVDELSTKAAANGDGGQVSIQSCRRFHSGPISSLSVCARKSLVASSSSGDLDNTIRVWDFRAHRNIITHYLEKGHHANSIAFHPSGNISKKDS